MARQRRKINPRNRKKPSREQVHLPEVFAKTIATFVPKIGEWIGQIKDPRNPNQIDYDLEVIMWSALFVGMLRLKAIRGINYGIGRNSPNPAVFLSNFRELFTLLSVRQHDLRELPDYGTVNNVLNRIDIKDVEEVIIKTVSRLIRHKVFEKLRLLEQYYLVAIDGTRTIKFKKRHCDKCLKRKATEDQNGEAIYEYYHYILDAKLVTHTGLCIPILTEFVENQEVNPDKQDCELKAFYRLSKRLKRYFPRLKIMLLLDSLYAGNPVLTICKENRWEYIIRFKEGSIPNVYKEYKNLAPLLQENQGIRYKDSNTKQEFQWVNEIDYEGHKVHMVEMKETNSNDDKKEGIRTFCFMSSLRIRHNNYNELVNKGGRNRWKIENQGFQTLKDKQGYNAEHAYNLNPNGGQVFYLLLQIGFIINQLIQNSRSIKVAIKEMGGIRYFVDQMYYVFSQIPFPTDMLKVALETAYQIRLDSS